MKQESYWRDSKLRLYQENPNILFSNKERYQTYNWRLIIGGRNIWRLKSE